MKRPMILFAAVWLSGILLGRLRPGLLVIFLCGYVLLLLFFLMYLRKFPAVLFPYVRKERYGAMTAFLLCLPLLFCGGFFRQQSYEGAVEKKLSAWQQIKAEEDCIFVIGTVTGKTIQEEKVILTLSDCVISVDGSATENSQMPVGNTILAERQVPEADWREAGDCQVTVTGEGSKWMAESFIGNRIRVYGAFYLYEAAGNPGQFDAATYYHGKGIFASVKAQRIEVLSEEISLPGQAMFLLKQKLRSVLSELYPENKAGVLVAMLLGDKDMLPEEIKELYQQNGISHILAISGLHISMICMGLFRILRRIGMSPWTASFSAFCFLGFYVIFTGAGTSSLRAGMMCLVLLAAKLLRRSYDLLSSLSLAAILVTLVRPQEITSAGFLLSFLAVLGVALAQEIERKRTEWREQAEGGSRWQALLWSASDSLLFGGMIQMVTLPVSLWFYYELSPYSILLNLLIIPLATFVLGGGIFSILVGVFFPEVAGFLAGGVYLLLSFYEWFCRVTQKLPYSFVLVGRPEIWQMVAYYSCLALTVWLVLRGRVQENGERQHDKKAGRLFAIGMFVCLFVLFLPQKKEFLLSFLDVSQGDGILLQTDEGKVLLFDGGSTDVSGVGEYRIGPFLKEQGIALIDVVSVSHIDSDHYSGVLELLAAMPVYEGRAAYLRDYNGAVGICELVLPEVAEPSEAYLEMVALCEEKNVTVHYLSAGDALYWEADLLIECLSPVDAKKSENDTSLVFLLQTSELVVWLMGDAGVETEEEIIHRLGEKVRETLAEKFCILKVGHHGSKTSTGDAFVSYVEPDVCVISCGYQNSYGHPHADVVRRLQDSGCEICRTDLQGCVMVQKGCSGEMEISGWR